MSVPLTELQGYGDLDSEPHAERFVVRVLLCAEDPLARAGLRAALLEPDIQVVGEVDQTRPLVDEVRRVNADVVILGGRGSNEESIDLSRYLFIEAKEICCPVAIVIDPTDHKFFLSCVQAGIRGFISKQNVLAEVSDAAFALARSRAYLSPVLALQHLDWFASRLARDTVRVGFSMDRLSAREKEVLHMLGSGMSNNEIADKLHISGATVRSHVYHIMTKLNLPNRTGVVLYGFQTNIHSH
jgi:DNA-binding NarL/FixJ family response regulator